MFGVLGLIVAIVCVIALIWKNWHMAIVSLAGALIGHCVQRNGSCNYIV